MFIAFQTIAIWNGTELEMYSCIASTNYQYFASPERYMGLSDRLDIFGRQGAV
jgi:hypothetical protein